jgi:hypothetical protein
MRKFQEISTARGRIKGLTITAELKRLFHEISILWHFSFFRENLYYFRTEHYEQNNSYSRFLELQKTSREGMTSAILILETNIFETFFHFLNSQEPSVHLCFHLLFFTCPMVYIYEYIYLH